MKKKAKYILVLGGTGFLGSNIINFYQQELQKNDIIFILAGITKKIINYPNCINVQINYTNLVELRKLIESYPIDEIFHFISTSVPATSNLNFNYDVQSNLISSLNLLELMREFNIKKIIYLSSGGTVYGESNFNDYQEDRLIAPNNSYGILKLTIEYYIKLYHKLYGINYLILRISNPFGIFHLSEVNGLINIAIRKSINFEPIEIWGDGTSFKDYIFATDFAHMFWQLIKIDCQNEIINIGSGNAYSINEIIGYIKMILPQTSWIYKKEKIFDTHFNHFNIEKLKRKITIRNTDILNAIEKTYQWELNKLIK